METQQPEQQPQEAPVSQAQQQNTDELEQKFIFENIDLGINDREMQGLISLMMAFDPDQARLNNEDSSEDDEDLFQGLSTLCNLQSTASKGPSEKVYRLTELFQPNEYDERIRQKMESYNKYKMPVFRQLISHEDLEKKKRNIKNDMKKTVEKLSRSEMPSIMMNDLDYMRKLKVNSDQAKASAGATKFQNNSNIEEIQDFVKPQKPAKQALVGQKRKKQVEFEAIVKQVEDDLKNNQTEKIQLKQKSFLLQQVEQNLEEIKMIEDYSRSDAEKTKELQQITIDQKMVEIQDKISKMDCESVLGNLSREEKDIIKISFKKDLDHQVNQAYPALITMNETEKKCYEFASQLVFDDYSTVEERGNGSKVIHQSSKKSLNLEGIKLKNDIFSIIGSRKNNKSEEQQISSIVNQGDQSEDCEELLFNNKFSGQPICKLQRDSIIRNKMTETKFQQNKLQRKKYWGEPKDCDSQGQINRDFYRFKPKQDQEKLKYFESDQFINFKTKYGGLNLCEAHPNNFKIDDLDEYEFVMRQRAYLYDPLYIKASNQFKNFSTQVGTGSFRRQFISKDGELVKSKMKIQKTFDKNVAQANLYINKPKQIQISGENKLESSSQMQNILKMLNIDLGDGTTEKQQDKQMMVDPPIQKNTGIDKLKQKQLKIEQQLKDTFDDVENLTNKVNIRKKKEYTKKMSEENKKNEQLNKKIVSTAYRSPTLPTLKPDAQMSHKSDKEMSDGGESNYSWNSNGERKINGKKGESDNFSSDESGKNPDIHVQDVDDVDDSFSDDIDVPEDFLDSSRIQEASHAECIQKLQYNKFYWDLYKGIDELIHFHRPNIQNYFKSEQNSKDPFAKYQLQIIDRETIKNKDKKRGNFKASKHFNDKKKLALKDGKFCIFEHIDENPIFVNNFGMVSKLVRYLYSERELPKQDYLNKNLNQKRKHMGPYGKQHLLGNKQKPPLLGNIDIKTFQGISVLQNELYNAPVFFHKPKQTDFFCSYRILEKNKKEGSDTESRKIILREIQSIFSVGQIEPKKPVFNPQSRNYQTFIKQHSKAYILRFLEEVQDERGQNGQIEFRDVQELFRLSDQNLKKFFKEIHVEVGRDQKCSITKPLSHETKINLISPEMICQYESAKYGEAMLMQRGIEKIINSDKISYASNKYCSEQKESLRQQISKFIENEVLCTPWNLSHNFCAHGTGGGMLMLQGVGDPSNDHGGYSFLKMPLKISSDCFRDCMQIRMQQNPAMQNPKSVTGTNADLRKLKKNDIFDKLVQMGYDQNVLRQQSRWQMVGTLRHRSSTSNVQNDNNKIYARGIRYTAKTQQEVYKKRVDKIFKTQMLYMTNKKHLNNDSDDEDPCKQFKIGENASKHQNLDDSDDEYNPNDLQRNIIEIADEKQILQLQQADPSDERLFPKVIHSGKIKKIQDIPNYKKLLIKKLQTHNQQNIQGQNDQQTGGIINIGGNSGNHQQDALMNSKNAEQQLDENLNKGDFEFDCEILKKVIRNEDNPEFIERIEFSCDEKVNRKFEKRQAKYKIKIERQNKTSIRDKIMQDQRVQKQRQGGDFQNRQSPEANPKEPSASQSQSQHTMVEDNSNVIKLSLFGGEPQKTNTTAAKTNNKPIGLSQIKGQDLNKFMQPPPKKPRGATSSKKGGGGGSRSTSKFNLEQNNNVLKITAAGGSKLQEQQIVEPQIIQQQLQPLEQQFLMPQNYLTEPIKQNFISIPIMMGGQQTSFQVAPEPQKQPSPKFIEKPKGIQQHEQPVVPRAPKKEQKPKKESNYNQSRDHQIIASLQQEQEATRRTSAMLQSSRRAKQSGISMLNNLIKKVIEMLLDKDKHNQWFRDPVERRIAPHYYNYITNPICLKNMKHKANRDEYTSPQNFLEDLELMKNNAIQFNGPHNPISVEAGNLENLGTDMMNGKNDSNFRKQVEEAQEKIMVEKFM